MLSVLVSPASYLGVTGVTILPIPDGVGGVGTGELQGSGGASSVAVATGRTSKTREGGSCAGRMPPAVRRTLRMVFTGALTRSRPPVSLATI